MRAFVAISRSQGQLSRARVFLYDCMFFFPPRAYALTYTILCVWAEVLRHVNFPTGNLPIHVYPLILTLTTRDGYCRINLYGPDGYLLAVYVP